MWNKKALILFCKFLQFHFPTTSLSSIADENVLTGFLLDLMKKEMIYNTHRTTHTTPRIKIATLIDVFWSSLFGFNIRGCVFVKDDSSVWSCKSFDQIIVFFDFFDTDFGVFDADVWKNLLSNGKKLTKYIVLKWYKVTSLKECQVKVKVWYYILTCKVNCLAWLLAPG